MSAGTKAGRLALGRRAALLAPLAMTGCSLFDGLFGDNKTPLPGDREAVLTSRRGLQVDEGAGRTVVLPPAVENAAWPQAGGNPAHVMGHLGGGDTLREAWRADLGAGGGYRAKILAQPVIANGRVFAMDSDGTVSAFEAGSGKRVWRAATTTDDDDSTNVGGGLAIEGDALYSVNGLGQLVVFNAATGAVRWRLALGAPARSSPMLADGRLFVTTIQDKLLALAADDGRKLWEHQAPSSVTTMLGLPAPAYADGLVIAGFGSGELAAMRADTGSVAWTDSLASPRGRNSISDLSAIRGFPVIADRRVYTIGLGGLLISNDLRSGRRLWEREIAGQTTPWVAGDWLFLISADQQIAAIGREDGRVAWITDLPRWGDPEEKETPLFWFGPVLVSDRLVVGGTNGEALAVSPFTGAVLGRQKLSGPASLTPVVAANTVFVTTDDGKLLALR